jgi:hypothetical protein
MLRPKPNAEVVGAVVGISLENSSLEIIRNDSIPLLIPVVLTPKVEDLLGKAVKVTFDRRGQPASVEKI